MAGASNIEWTDATWNPISGCAIISPGCTNCYAMRMAGRLRAMGHKSYAGVTRKSGRREVWTGKLRINDDVLDYPLRWKKPRRVFVNSMSDLFQEGVPDLVIGKVWHVMAQCQQHTFQILTKRPERLSILAELGLPTLPNVWLGTSVESGRYNSRIDELRKANAAFRFVSFEPLIDSVGPVDLHGIDWAIVGGESGPSARPMDAAWVDEIFHQCERFDVAFFFKKWGGTNKKAAGRIYRGRHWDEYPSTSETMPAQAAQ